jgi:hypothetical protein
MKNALAGLSLGLGLTVTAQAETLQVEGIYAAGEDGPSEVQLIAMGNFGGRSGDRVALAIEDQLRRASFEGQPYFDITFDSSSGDRYYYYDSDPGPAMQEQILVQGGPEATMRGYVSTEVREERSGDKEVTECVKRDDKDKCIEEKPVKYECYDMIVSLRPEVRLVTRDGRSLYSKSDYLTRSERYCADERRTPSVDSMVQSMVDQFASTVRYDMAPSYRSQGIRVLESRKGIAKADRKAFGNAIKLTKSDPVGACMAFEALEPGNPQDVSILFNIGLCRESDGNLEEAAERYRRVLAIEPGKDYAEDGLRRIASRRRAQRQLDIHFGPAEE